MNTRYQENTTLNVVATNLVEKLNNYLKGDRPPDVLIIKAHLLCEYYINQILILKEACEVSKLEKMDFYDKSNIALEGTHLHGKINKLNKLRNKIGHELEYALSEADIDSLGYLFGKEYILKKYQETTQIEHLRKLLTKMVIQLALLVIDLINQEKNTIDEKN